MHQQPFTRYPHYLELGNALTTAQLAPSGHMLRARLRVRPSICVTRRPLRKQVVRMAKPAFEEALHGTGELAASFNNSWSSFVDTFVRAISRNIAPIADSIQVRRSPSFHADLFRIHDGTACPPTEPIVYA